MLPCVCGDPLHYIVFGYNRPYKDDIWEQVEPELWISVRFIRGTFWKRLRTAWRYIITGEYHMDASAEIEGWDELEKLNAFLDECLSEKGER